MTKICCPSHLKVYVTIINGETKYNIELPDAVMSDGVSTIRETATIEMSESRYEMLLHSLIHLQYSAGRLHQANGITEAPHECDNPDHDHSPKKDPVN